LFLLNRTCFKVPKETNLHLRSILWFVFLSVIWSRFIVISLNDYRLSVRVSVHAWVTLLLAMHNPATDMRTHIAKQTKQSKVKAIKTKQTKSNQAK
jgi:hypothetical protein